MCVVIDCFFQLKKKSWITENFKKTLPHQKERNGKCRTYSSCFIYFRLVGMYLEPTKFEQKGYGSKILSETFVVLLKDLYRLVAITDSEFYINNEEMIDYVSNKNMR